MGRKIFITIVSVLVAIGAILLAMKTAEKDIISGFAFAVFVLLFFVGRMVLLWKRNI